MPGANLIASCQTLTARKDDDMFWPPAADPTVLGGSKPRFSKHAACDASRSEATRAGSPNDHRLTTNGCEILAGGAKRLPTVHPAASRVPWRGPGPVWRIAPGRRQGAAW